MSNDVTASEQTRDGDSDPDGFADETYSGTIAVRTHRWPIISTEEVALWIAANTEDVLKNFRSDLGWRAYDVDVSVDRTSWRQHK